MTDIEREAETTRIDQSDESKFERGVYRFGPGTMYTMAGLKTAVGIGSLAHGDYDTALDAFAGATGSAVIGYLIRPIISSLSDE